MAAIPQTLHCEIAIYQIVSLLDKYHSQYYRLEAAFNTSICKDLQDKPLEQSLPTSFMRHSPFPTEKVCVSKQVPL